MIIDNNNKDVVSATVVELDKEEIKFNDTKEKDDRYKYYWKLFTSYKDSKEQNVRFFSKNGIDRNILDYIKDSVDRMNEYKTKPAYKENWQNNVFEPVTRDKIIAILSRMASTRLKAEVIVKVMNIFKVENIELRKSIYQNLLDNANEHNREDMALVWDMYSCLSEGTVIGYESWKRDERTVEYVKEFNPDTGEKTTETITYDSWDDVYGCGVPVEEFFPETIWTSDFNDIKRCFRAREMTYAQFIDTYGKYENADKVKTVNYYQQSRVEWGIPADTEQKSVFCLEWYDETKDKMGVWCNGTELYWSCLPWNHKQKPFWMAIGEPIHRQFIFGKSFPDKLMSMQDLDNSLLNAILDQIFIALNSPLFIDGHVDLDDGYLEPGRVYEVDPGTKVERGALGIVDPSAFNVLSLIKRSMEMSTLSDQAQGIPTGGRKTKYEVQQLQEGAMQISSLFLQMMESAMTQKYKLRLANILQYYSMPSRAKTGKKKFKYIEIKNAKLSNGKYGKRKIQIVGSPNEIPNKDELKNMAEVEENKEFDILESKIEPIIITRDYLLNKDYNVEIKIVPNSSMKESLVDKYNKDIAFYNATVNNPMVDQVKNTKDLAAAFGKDEDIVKEQSEEENPMARIMQGGMNNNQPEVQPNMEMI